ncbi:MAG: type IV secretion system DNA-binding domain-containing protein, partial [bacterium]|nr:type IV secretion system DNA-binding domain-containing protein [bacterium]
GKEIVRPNSAVGAGESKPVELAGPVVEALGGIENKATKLGYEVIMRVVSISDNELNAKTRIQSVLGAYKQFNTTNMNGFSGKEISINDTKNWLAFINRSFEKKSNIFNTEELASVYHFPNMSVETPNLTWAGSRKSEAPVNIPIKGEYDDNQLTLLGKTDFRNTEREFGIKLIDRMQHVYIIGKSGGGKSKLMLNMIRDDIMEGRGVIVVDPHGELADEVIAIVPPARLDDVIVFDPADREFPIAFNLLEQVGEDFKGMVASGFVGIFKKIFGFSWGPRLEHILRNTVLALLDYPESTMLSIPKMLTEKGFREKVIDYIKDPVIQDFWVNEFSGMDQKFQSEAVSPILNKVGQFLSTPTIRNIVGQKKSALNIRTVMDRQQIMIVNLSRGKIGEDNAALMGAMMITKVQLAAMSRADVVLEERPACFLYVDEFQNFATESFAVILSEARKYNLGLTLAHQYVAQMPEEVRDAVFGNVGTLISFRIGAPDAEALTKELKPFEADDLVNLEKYHIYIKLLIDGIAPPAFSAMTLTPPELDNQYREQIINQSRQKYSSARKDVEEGIEQWAGFKEKMEARLRAREVGEVLRSSPVAAKPSTKFGSSLTEGQGSARPQTPVAKPVEQPVVVDEVVPAAPIEQGSGVSETEVVLAEEPKEYKPKQLRVIGNRAYKEHSQRGGVKWFVGEPLDLAIAREQDRAKNAAHSPTPTTSAGEGENYE